MSDHLAEMSFETAFEALGEIVNQLEQGDLPLAESIALYEQGIALAKLCNQHLDTADLRIKQLTESGGLAEVDIT